MIHRFRAWLIRPLAEDFSVKNQGRLSVQAGIYVFVFLTVFNAAWADWQARLSMHALFAIGCVCSSFLANIAIPRLLPVWYDEDRWTVGRHIVHVLLVLLIISLGNQLIVWLLRLPAPSFLAMYCIVTAIGFCPIFVGVMVAERRRLKRNLAQASQLNKQLNELHQPHVPGTADVPELPGGILLTSDTGKERLSLLPNQLIYVESVGNYVEVYWLNFMFPQKTVLRSTLKDVEAAIANDPQFFRCHRAFLVNLRAVNHTTGNSRGYQLTMSGSNREIPVSRSYLASFDERMAQLV